ncbi:MAG: transglycosylase domain-containing protein [Clostridia bacterium]|nr:transglycosylase domain-containing protein [Clostridia bacterium]
MNNNFDDQYENLFDTSDEDISTNDQTDMEDILSSDSEVLDLNNLFVTEDFAEETEEDPKKQRKQKKGKKGRKIWQSIIAIFLVFVMLGCVGVGAMVGYVIMFIDGTMDENLNALTLDYSTTIYAKSGGEWVEYQRLHGEENRIWVDYNREKAENEDPEYTGIPQNLALAFVAIEDKRFFDHEGVDWRRTFGAFINMVTNRTTSGYGGSSITQQLVKNLTKDADRSADRKLREIMRSRYLESKYAKEVILECYMNTIAMGNGLYGVEVAAEFYYGKNVNELTLAECASLAGITNIPETYRPDKNPEKNEKRRNLVLSLMLEQKLITQEEYDEAVAEPLNVVADRSILKETSVNSYFVDALIDDVVTALMEKYGWEKERAEANFYNGGYKIYATVDPNIQSTMESVYADETYNIKGSKGEHLQGSMVVMDYSGNVLGMVGGMGEKTENRGLNRATMSPRQPGSTIKPLSAYAPAIERDLITYSTIVDDCSTYYNRDTWRPVNWYRSYKGKVTIEYALEISMNTIPVYLVDLLTKQKSFDFLTGTLGFKHLTDVDADYSPLGMGGTNGGYTTLEATAAFAIFGNKGRYYSPITFTKIYDQYDNEILSNKSDSTIAISEDTSYIMNKLLQNVVNGSEGTAGGARSYISMPFFAKTGTANHANDIWFVGGSPYYVASSWCGYDELQKITDSKRARKMWGAVMSKIHKGLSNKGFPASKNVELRLYCSETGLLANSECIITDYGWYKTKSMKYCTEHGGEPINIKSESEAKTFIANRVNPTVPDESTETPPTDTTQTTSSDSAPTD